MTHREKAKELFFEGYNCSQAVFAAFCDVTGMDEETALKISSSFGGGLGRLREVCGALSGAEMVLGMLCGNTDPKLKQEHYVKVRQIAEEFKKQRGSIICREILGLRKGENSGPKPDARTEEYYKKRPCAIVVEEASEIIDEYIKNELNA